MIKQLTKNELLYYEIEIFELALGYKPDINKTNQLNTLRLDKSPGSVRFFISNSRMYMKDFSTGECIDCFEAIRQRYNLTHFNQIINFVNNNLGKLIYQNDKPIYQQKSLTYINYVETTLTKDYWYNYGIEDQELNQYPPVKQVKPIVEINNSLLSFNNDVFAYQFNNNRVKLYSPRGTPKWLSNTTKDDIYGNVNGAQTLIITSSGKDQKCLSAIIRRNKLDIDVIAPQSETQLLDLKLISKNIIINFDNDKAGINAANKYNQKKWFTEGAKDVSDLFMQTSETEVLKQLSSII